MENPASIGEETHTEKGVTAIPPGNEINHNQVPHLHIPIPWSDGTLCQRPTNGMGHR